jgi:hypothetical protein
LRPGAVPDNTLSKCASTNEVRGVVGIRESTMAGGTPGTTLQASGNPDVARRRTVHPFALYLAAIEVEHTHGNAAEQNRRPSYSAVDALPLSEPAPKSRRGRLTAIVRRRVTRAAGA